MSTASLQTVSNKDTLTREGIEWLNFLRSVSLREEDGGSLARRIILFGQSLRNMPHHDGDVGVVNEPLLNEEIK
jgi:hypothetical protein